MTEREALYAVIRNDPADVTLRLAWADYLDEHGGAADCKTCGGTGYVRSFKPSPWAKAVLAALPVMEFEVADRKPYHNGLGYCWYNGARHSPTLTVPMDADLPMWLFRELSEGERWQDYPTPEAAVDALAAAAGRVVRRAWTAIRSTV